jgi:hypothetical protein
MGILGFLQRRQKYSSIQLYTEGNDKRLTALVADTVIKRMIGLMYREKLDEGQCMLFLFRHNGIQGIWMRNMRFPIDIVWADAKKRVVHVVEGAQPCKGLNCKTYYPKEPSMYVVEVAAGTARTSGMVDGARLVFECK